MRVRHYLSTHHNHSLACPWIRPPTSRTVTHWTVHAAPRCGHVRWQRPRPHANGAYAPVSLSSQLDLVLAKSQAHCCGASRVPAARTNDSWLPTERGQCMASAGSTRWSRGPGGGSPCSHARSPECPHSSALCPPPTPLPWARSQGPAHRRGTGPLALIWLARLTRPQCAHSELCAET